jgi:DNA modification methylase
MQHLEIAYVDIASLKPRANNPRIHSKAQIQLIANSIKEFGFVSPVLTDAEKNVLAGHGRLEAAALVGMKEVPTVCISHLSAAQARALLIADNKVAELAGWNRDLLALELKELETASLKMTDFGFNAAELEAFKARLRSLEPKNLDAVPEIDKKAPPVSRLGDIWAIGSHALACGSALDASVYERLLGGKAACVFTDPPYNVPVKGHVSGLGKMQHREFAMASGEMTQVEFEGFLEIVFRNLANYTVDGAIHFYCMDWRHMEELQAAARSAKLSLQNLCIWVKSNGGMGSLYRSRHELVFVYKNGTAPHTNNVELGKNGRNRTNVWEYPGMTAFGAKRDAELALHPTVKPVEMVADALLDCSKPGDVIWDPFSGSGTTLVAAETVGRVCCAIELDAYYVDTAVKRLVGITGAKTELVETGETFEEVAARRAAEACKAA